MLSSRLTNPLFLLWSLFLWWTPAVVSEELTSPGGLTAEIISCSGWALNRFPKLKEFLKGGEAESYKGVHIHYVHGKTAVMTIFKDGEETEKVHLHKIDDKDQLHKIFREKGFEPMSAAELAKSQQEKQDEKLKINAKAESKKKKFLNALRKRGNSEVANQVERIKAMKGVDSLAPNKELMEENNARIESKRLAQEGAEKGDDYTSMMTEGNGFMAGGLMASMVGLAIIVTMSRASRRKKLHARR